MGGQSPHLHKAGGRQHEQCGQVLAGIRGGLIQVRGPSYGGGCGSMYASGRERSYTNGEMESIMFIALPPPSVILARLFAEVIRRYRLTTCSDTGAYRISI